VIVAAERLKNAFPRNVLGEGALKVRIQHQRLTTHGELREDVGEPGISSGCNDLGNQKPESETAIALTRATESLWVTDLEKISATFCFR
jgi:hypothetical protein